MLPESIHRNIFIFGLITLVTGLSVGAIFISIGIIILSANWILEGNFKPKLEIIKSNKVIWLFLFFFFLHIVGLIWSKDFFYGGKDIKIKLPILALPIVFASTRKLNQNELKLILKIYLTGILLSSLWSLVFYLGLKELEINDVRRISRFFSHIRFSMNIVFGTFISWWIIKKSNKISEKISFLILSLWFIIFLFLLSSLTGIFLLIITSTVYVLYFVFSQKKWSINFLVIVAIVTLLALLGQYFYSTYKFFFTTIEKKEIKPVVWTPSGDLYFHENNYATENGYFVWRHISYLEIEKSWKKRSKINFEEKDKKGNSVKFTLIRYLTSKGHKKDSVGMSKLSDADIKNIENGIPNYKLAKASSLQKRTYDMFWEIKDFFDNGPSLNHSIMIRALYWKTAFEIIKEYPILGCGTGDIQNEFEKRYKNVSMKINPNEMRRSHNQFLEIWATLGISGLLPLIIILILPFLKFRKYHPLIIPVAIILFLSMFSEDTLETQAGVSLFALFIPLFLFAVERESDKDLHD